MERLDEKTRKQLITVLAAGLFLILLDTVMSAGGGAGMVKKDGGTYIVRPLDETEYMDFLVTVEGRDGPVEERVSIALDPPRREGEDRTAEEERTLTEGEVLSRSIDSAVSSVESGGGEMVLLPSRLETGERIRWQRERSSSAVPIAVLTMMAAVIVYRNRYAIAERRRREERDSVMRELPEFVNRLVLLLNAGLVINDAFERAIEEMPAKKDGCYFQRNMADICRMARTTNASVCREFQNFAARSGMKELMRISSIIMDNVSKGTGLTEKLERESSSLWHGRKKSCEERGRLAETKLTLPLLIFLSVLIMITVSPALLEL